MPSFISPTKTLLLKQNEKMLQGFFLPQKKKENIPFSRTISFLVNHHNTSPFFFVLRSLLTNVSVDLFLFFITTYPTTKEKGVALQ
jgi:hypothetical protein